MDEIPPEKLVAGYHRGMITGHELVWQLITAATRISPKELLPLVPEELLNDVRQRGLNPPDSPEAAPRVIASVCSTGAFDWNAWQREQQAKYYDGVWRWYRFLTEQASRHL
ncbi:hypothetical protein R5W24_003773 [Gemmata sp. JC717]|uniref:hypothetical protein n=1 Tax=Gemmata algarum TaxID=2975278 RepID=UPI0021BB3A09|nr:hypothetical protein [Gemmata algarum]MDY3554647.1 hypothetical protein [Gemmata algarum]